MDLNIIYWNLVTVKVIILQVLEEKSINDVEITKQPSIKKTKKKLDPYFTKARFLKINYKCN